jgi:hypothetical protein
MENWRGVRDNGETIAENHRKEQCGFEKILSPPDALIQKRRRNLCLDATFLWTSCRMIRYIRMISMYS